MIINIGGDIRLNDNNNNGNTSPHRSTWNDLKVPMKRFMHTIIESICIDHPGNSIAENNFGESWNIKETSCYLVLYKPAIFLRKRLVPNLNIAFDNQAFLGGNAIFIEPRTN